MSSEKLDIIAKVNLIAEQYRAKGFSLTLRQIYYVFVANDLFPDDWKYANTGNNKWVLDKNGTKNAPPNYGKLGDIVSDGRIAGLIDWYTVEDRSRSSYANQHFERPSQCVEAALNTYATDKWKNQPHYVEVWVEKEALENVLTRACSPLDVRYFACKGYTSQSSMWEASQRLVRKIEDRKQVHIIHLGDHDPSGIDMSRDIFSRLSMFTYSKVHVQRIALNMAQVERYNPPPNPAKVTDSRFKEYQEKFGDESWELDALEPTILVDLIQRAIGQYRDEDLWNEAVQIEQKGKGTIQYICQYFPEVVAFLREKRKEDKSEVICSVCGATRNNPKCLCDLDGRGIALPGAPE